MCQIPLLLPTLCPVKAKKGVGTFLLLLSDLGLSMFVSSGPACSFTAEQEASSDGKGQVLIRFSSAVVEVLWDLCGFQW